MSFEDFKEKINDPSLATSRLEKIFYQALGIGIFIVGAIPTLLFFIAAPGMEEGLKGLDSDMQKSKKK